MPDIIIFIGNTAASIAEVWDSHQFWLITINFKKIAEWEVQSDTNIVTKLKTATKVSQITADKDIHEINLITWKLSHVHVSVT